MCKAWDDMGNRREKIGLEKGIEIGIEKGIEKAIAAFVLYSKKIGETRDYAITNIKDIYDLSEEKASEFYDNTLALIS